MPKWRLRPKANLKRSVAFILVILGFVPLFGYELIRFLNKSLHNIDPYGVFGIFLGSGLTLPFFLLLATNSRFAESCAHDPKQVGETMATARSTSWVIGFLLALSVVFGLVGFSHYSSRQSKNPGFSQTQ